MGHPPSDGSELLTVDQWTQALNPPENIRNTQTIWQVIQGGWHFDPVKLRPPESPASRNEREYKENKYPGRFVYHVEHFFPHSKLPKEDGGA